MQNKDVTSWLCDKQDKINEEKRIRLAELYAQRFQEKHEKDTLTMFQEWLNK
jgi:hypothetical protein